MAKTRDTFNFNVFFFNPKIFLNFFCTAMCVKKRMDIYGSTMVEHWERENNKKCITKVSFNIFWQYNFNTNIPSLVAVVFDDIRQFKI